VAPLANFFLRRRWVKNLAALALGIDARRDFPAFAPQTFQSWFHQRRNGAATVRERTVVLFDDCFLSYNYPQVGQAATQLLEKAGYQVVLAKAACCGRPMISKGLLEDARAAARRNVEALAPLVEQGAIIVGCEPSCLLTLRDEYLDLLQGPQVEKVAQASYLFEEFLIRRRPDLRFRPLARKVLVHGHCHQKAHLGSGPTLQALRLVPGLQVTEINSGCCGMAGSFGFEKEHYELSRAIAAQRLVPAVNAAPPDAEIVITGVSCRQQISHFTSRNPRHAVELLREAVE
jgi:Fe-S oxidoreductase